MRPHGNRNVATVVDTSMTLKLKLNAQAIRQGCVLHQPFVQCPPKEAIVDVTCCCYWSWDCWTAPDWVGKQFAIVCTSQGRLSLKEASRSSVWALDFQTNQTIRTIIYITWECRTGIWSLRVWYKSQVAIFTYTPSAVTIEGTSRCTMHDAWWPTSMRNLKVLRFKFKLELVPGTLEIGANYE